MTKMKTFLAYLPLYLLAIVFLFGLIATTDVSTGFIIWGASLLSIAWLGWSASYLGKRQALIEMNKWPPQVK